MRISFSRAYQFASATRLVALLGLFVQVACARIGEPVAIEGGAPLPKSRDMQELAVSFTEPEFALCVHEHDVKRPKNNFIKVRIQFSGAVNEVAKSFSVTARADNASVGLLGKGCTRKGEKKSTYKIALDNTPLPMLYLASCEGAKSNLVEFTIQCLPPHSLLVGTPVNITVTVVRKDQNQQCVLKKTETLTVKVKSANKKRK